MKRFSNARLLSLAVVIDPSGAILALHKWPE